MSAAFFNGIIAAHADRIVAMSRPAEPTGSADVWYRGWEVGYHEMAAQFYGDGWCAYKGGCDLDAPSVSARTFNDCLDAIDDECAA